eukprot:7376416-Prymnesium_polylepis.2
MSIHTAVRTRTGRMKQICSDRRSGSGHRARPITRARRHRTIDACVPFSLNPSVDLTVRHGRSGRYASVRMALPSSKIDLTVRHGRSKIDLYCHEELAGPTKVRPEERDATNAPQTAQAPETHVTGDVAIDFYCNETLPPASPERPPTPHRPGDLCTIDEMLRILVQNL